MVNINYSRFDLIELRKLGLTLDEFLVYGEMVSMLDMSTKMIKPNSKHPDYSDHVFYGRFWDYFSKTGTHHETFGMSREEFQKNVRSVAYKTEFMLLEDEEKILFTTFENTID